LPHASLYFWSYWEDALTNKEKTVCQKKIVVSGNTVADRIHILSIGLSEDGKYVFPSKDGTVPADVANRLGIDLSHIPNAIIPGGQAATPADLLEKLGNRVFFVGSLGNNADARFVEDDFKNNNINYTHSPRCSAEHFRADVYVGTNATRLILMYKDPNLNCDNVPLDWIEREKPDVIYVDGNEPELALRLAQKGKDLGIPVVCDLEDLKQPHDFLDYVSVLIAPAKIIKQLGGSESPEKALQCVAQMGFSAVVATDGERGCFGIYEKKIVHLDGITVDVKDTTGASDTFHAAFVDALVRGYGFEDSMSFANKIAALNCTFVGGRIPKHVVQAVTLPQAENPCDASMWLRSRPVINRGLGGEGPHL